MKLSKLEYWAMNNPIRRLVQKHIEFHEFKKFLQKHQIDLKNKAILDIGCSSGYSSELIQQEFSPTKIIAFDYMLGQILLAKKKKYRASFFVGNAAHIALPSNSFEAVFIFGVLHHVPKWQQAISEIARILKVNGVLLLEEPGRKTIYLANLLGLKHPKEARFSWAKLEQEFQRQNFCLLEKRKLLSNEFRRYLFIKTSGTSAPI